MIITSGDAVYKLDYNKVLEYHIAKKADITVVCKDLDDREDATRFGTVRMNESARIEEFEEKPMVAKSQTISTGIYVIRRRLLIDLIEHCAEEERHDFVTDILIRYKNLKKIYGYKINSYWNNISTVDAYYQTNMDFLKPEVRKYFFKDAQCVFQGERSAACKIQSGSSRQEQPYRKRKYHQWNCGKLHYLQKSICRQ